MNLESYFWSRPTLLNYILLPAMALYYLLVTSLFLLYQLGIVKRFCPPTPLIVIGNITMGGNGKTPILIALVNWLRGKGYRVGVVSKGYPHCPMVPVEVDSRSTVQVVGDEPLLIFAKTEVPVVVAQSRVKAIEYINKMHSLDLIIADDGLQQYHIKKSITIVATDAHCIYNTFMLPSGPYREPQSRLQNYSATLTCGERIDHLAGFSYSRKIEGMINTKDNKHEGLEAWKGREVVAVSGIARAERFFSQLRKTVRIVEQHIFPDHHNFTSEDFAKIKMDRLPIIMTEKDMIKSEKYSNDYAIYVAPLTITIENNFFAWFENEIKKL